VVIFGKEYHEGNAKLITQQKSAVRKSLRNATGQSMADMSLKAVKWLNQFNKHCCTEK